AKSDALDAPLDRHAESVHASNEIGRSGGRRRPKKMVGARGFEPPPPWARTRCSTRLSHAPTAGGRKRPACCAHFLTPRSEVSHDTSALGARPRACERVVCDRPDSGICTTPLDQFPGSSLELVRHASRPSSGTKRHSPCLRLFQLPSGVRCQTSRYCESAPPTGITRRPRSPSCTRKASGTRGAAAATRTLSYGENSCQP